MKQIIPFVKDIAFSNNIYEITSIDLKHELNMENNDSIVGYFLVSGKYKMNKISINEEEFNEKINFDITLDNKYDDKKITIDIDNFYYEIIDDQILRVHIDLLIDNLVYLKEERCIEDEIIDNEPEIIENIKEEVKEDIKNEVIQNEGSLDESYIKENDNKKISNGPIFSFDTNYATYKVHIIRDGDTLDKVIQLYDISKEELEKYNNLENIVLGTKIIVPLKNE